MSNKEANLLAQRLVQVVPHPRQIAWQRLEFTAFIHFGINTFTNREWGDRTEDPRDFNPTQLDTDQWCKAMVDAGMKACLITAKHHDGFCLFDTKTTKHSVMHSPYGKDVVAQVAKSCEKYGLKMGVYLSPWDMYEPCYGQGTAYDDFFCTQLEELLTNYGELYSVWFDGANGEGPNGKKQRYDWDRYYALIRKHQPGACISVCGPDVRWCGNEAGDSRSSEWSVVPAVLADAERVQSLSQQEDSDAFRRRGISSQDQDLGSREQLKDDTDLAWYPAEVNVSIRPGWFYHASEDDQVKSVATLLDMYEKSAGGNALFLLNLPPDKRGLIHENDVAVLKELGDTLRTLYKEDIAPQATVATSHALPEHPGSNALTSGESYWKPEDGTEAATITLRWSEPQDIGAIVLQEQITQSQRIEKFTITTNTSQGKETLCQGTVVGYQRICRFPKVKTDNITLHIEESRVAPTLRRFQVFAATDITLNL